MSQDVTDPFAAGGRGNAPAGWYTDPTTGAPLYWNGHEWDASQVPSTPDSKRAAMMNEQLAGDLKRHAWWRFVIAVAIGSAVALIVLFSTTSTVLWWGGYVVAGSLAWGSVRRLRLAAEITGGTVGAGSWAALLAGVGIVGALAFQAATYWSAPYEPTSSSVVGSCWGNETGGQVAPVDCDSADAGYQAVAAPSSPDYCPLSTESYITLSDGTTVCLARR